MSKTKAYNDKTLPFTIFSSSVNTGYQAELSTSFKPNISIENNHEDYNNEYLEGNIQGIYAKDLVGGYKSNHIEISSSYTPQDRPERYKLYFGTGSALGNLYITSVDSGSSKDFVSRFPFAKRPFGIQNIQGKNFRNNYEIVTTSGYKINNRDFYHSGGYAEITASEIPFLAHNRNYAMPSRTKTNKSVLRTKFGLGEKKIGSYDYSSQEYTVYNAQPWKNYTARNVLKTKNSRKFIQSDYSGDDIYLGDYSRWFSKTKVNCNVGWNSKNSFPGYPYIQDGATNEITSSFCIVRLEPHAYSFVLLEEVVDQFRYHYKNYNKFDGAYFDTEESLYYDLIYSVTEIVFHKITKTQVNPLQFDSKSSIIYYLTGAYGIEGSLIPYEKPIRLLYNDKLTSVAYYRQLAPQYDNEFVTHQIPQNDIQYSWLRKIMLPTCYNGYYNTDRLASFFTASKISQYFWSNNYIDTLSYESGNNAFNITYEKHGIFGWPSWKQYQTNNSLLRYQKKNSYINNRGIPYKESNLSYNFPAQQRLRDQIVYKYSLKNISKRFENETLEEQTNTKLNETFYDFIQKNNEKSLYLEYKEQIYPKNQYLGFDILRRRSNFDKWWDSKRENRYGQIEYNPIELPSYSIYFSTWPLDEGGDEYWWVRKYRGIDEIPAYDTWDGATVQGKLQFSPTIFYRNIFDTAGEYPDSDYIPFVQPTYIYPTTSGSWPNWETDPIYVFYNTNWETANQAGRQPYYSDYNQYLENIRPYTKDKTIIPEFRISEHIDNYLENGGDFYVENEDLFTISEGYYSASSQNEFYPTYSLSNDNILKDIEAGKPPTKIELSCEGLIKFYPYKGLYPVERTLYCAELFSSSYSWETGSDSVYNSAYGRRPMYQSLFMPGILYNTIKAGVAVNTITPDSIYGLVMTGSDADRTRDDFQQTNTYDEDIPRYGNLDFITPRKLPFETLIEPEQYLKGYIMDLQVNPCSRGRYVNYNLTNNDPKYQLSMHNFLAESVELFLKNGELSSFASKAQNKIVVDGNKTNYSMIVQMYSKPWENLSESNTYYYKPLFYMFSSGSAFGPPAGIYKEGQNYKEHNYSLFTPPYFGHPEGSTMLLKFTPWKTESNEYTIEEIVNNLEIIGDSISVGADPAVGRSIGIPPDNALVQTNKYYGSEVYGAYLLRNGYTLPKICNKNGVVVDLTSSININIVEKYKDVEYDPQTNLPIKVNDTVDKSVWIIQTKYETPMLNFRNCECDVSDFPAGAVGAGCKGMWMQYGQKLQDGEGVYLKIKDPETFAGSIYKFDSNNTGSLADLVGFDKKEIRLGEVHDSKFIREAIVAVPYMDSMDIREKSYFYFDENLIEVAEKEDETRVSKNMIETFKALKKYVFPPKFDWNKNRYKKINSKTSTNIVKPIKMFVFEFEREFSSQDLLDIWQNIMPESYQKFEQQQRKITINLEEEPEILENIRNVKWMFFKVKQKAEKNYFAKTADTSDDSRFKFELKYGGKGRKNFVPDYSYNWPYDWMSIVEFCGVTLKAEFGEE